MVLVANWEVQVHAPCWDGMWEQGLEEMRVFFFFFFLGSVWHSASRQGEWPGPGQGKWSKWAEGKARHLQDKPKTGTQAGQSQGEPREPHKVGLGLLSQDGAAADGPPPGNSASSYFK